MTTDRQKFLLLYIISCVLNLSVLFAMHPVRDPLRLETDALEYYRLAGEVLDHSYHFDTRRVLGHVLILAVFRKFTAENLVALQVLVSLFFSFVSPFVYLLSRRFCPNPRVGVAAALAAALWPLFLIYGRTLYSETTALPFFIAFLALLPRGVLLGGDLASIPPWRWILSGIMFALCLLIRPMYLIFTPFLCLVIMSENGWRPKSLTAVIWLLLGCVISVAPWTIYSSVHAKRFVLLSSNGGETLAGGLNPNLISRGYVTNTTPDGRVYWAGPGKWSDESETGYLTIQELKWSREARDRVLMKRAWTWVVKHPEEALYLEWAKLSYMWGIYPIWNGLQQTLFGNVPTLALVFINMLGVMIFRRRLQQFIMLYALPLFSSSVALISWGSWRFRQPGDVGLLILAVFLLWPWISGQKLRFYGDLPDDGEHTDETERMDLNRSAVP